MSKNSVGDSTKLLDVQNAALFLGVSVGTIRRWTHNRQLKGVKVGLRGDWRFTIEDLSKMVRGQWENDVSEQAVLKPTPFRSKNTSMTIPLLAPRLDWREMNESDHFVQFCENDAILLDSLGKFIGLGLNEGDLCIVVATENHRKGLDERLKTFGIDIINVQVEGNYLSLDANETLEKFMVDGFPNAVRFFTLINDLLKRASEKKQRVRIFGEMVALLWNKGNYQSALELEKLWNNTGKSHTFSLYCAYPMQGFDRETYGKPFNDIGLSHSRVIPAESYNDLTSTTERLRAITKLQQKAASLEAEIAERKKLEKQKDEFISMASHELKTPVTSLMAYTQVLEKRMRKRGDVAVANHLQSMDSQLKKLTHLIGDLLDLSKMQAGKLPFTSDVFPLQTLVKDIVQTVQITSPKHTIRLQGKTQANVYGDRDRIGQIIINLLTNAMKYSPDAKTVVVRVQTVGDRVKISVQDYGIGIAKSNHEKIFTRFYLVADCDTKTYPGLGIGLYIAQQIAFRHDGEIKVESEKGKGSTFSLLLPVHITTSKKD